MPACRSRTNADDRLPLVSLGPVEGGDGIVEGRDSSDVRSQSSVPHTLDDFTQLATIGLDRLMVPSAGDVQSGVHTLGEPEQF